MATLLLTGLGRMLGGPLGGAVGAIVGQTFDQAVLFKPKGRQGPRLGDLSVQTSSYGSPIPRLFGTMRVAGTVIWATDLIEDRHKSGGGKGRPSVTSYSYSASFAVLLSARPIRRVGRIWADGKLLRGAAGDFKTETGYRLHLGGEDQPVDPLIAAAEGMAMTPAQRGGAYAVFEGFQLGAYGNRIPSLTFEVEADAGPVGVGAVIGALTGGAVGGEVPAAFGGFAASGDSVRAVIDSIADAVPLSISDDGTALTLAGAAPGAVIGAGERRAAAGGADDEQDSRAAAGSLPAEVTVSYYEPARDYQAGLQRARRPGPGRGALAIALPAALDAGAAKALAEARIARDAAGRLRRRVALGWRRMAIRPGDRIGFAGEGGRWRVAGWTLERMALALDLVRETSAPMLAPPAAEPGRGNAAPDLVHGPTVVHLLDLPPIEDVAPSEPRLFVAAAGPEPGWRRAALLLSTDDGGRWQPIGATAAPAVIGVAETVLPAGSTTLFDAQNAVTVVLLNDAVALAGADDPALIGGANLALIGEELIQFGAAEPLGGGRWRITRLLRGRRGTEWAIGGHAADERFVLIEAEALARFTPPASAVGGTIRVMASGVGDGAGAAEAWVEAAGCGMRPPAPIALAAMPLGDGGFALRWTRRSRDGWLWRDGGDVPVGEPEEAYRVSFTRADGSVRAAAAAVPTLVYPPADVAGDAAHGAQVTITVVQQGGLAASRPATLVLSIG
ncbi:phage tail protein [Sphingomonas flavalba]|uniref:phage tail protein n=1 Tax=Sphingomonas flavalba TaxID=2559804 RepID=UPI0039E065F0